MRTTVSEMGPQLLSRLLELNETQEGILNIVFRIADDRGLLLIDMKDLRSMLNYVAENARQYTASYGNITAQSVGAIQRALLTLENQGADKFFAEPSFDIYDLLQCEQGKGVMNVLAADRLMLQPKLYSTFLLWLLSELYSQLPEVGDMDLPKLVFFFDEAHMLFDETSKALVDKIEQVVRLIRSKGVGVYFVTQSPTDIPEEILGQLGNRVQHALRAFTPKDQKAVKTAAETFRANPSFKTAEAIMELGTGEALVSFLDDKGAPSMVERARILFPLSQIGAVTEGQRGQIMNQSRLYGKYDKVVDRESAFEVLMEESEAALAAEAEAKAATEKKSGKGGGLFRGIVGAVVGAVVTSVTSSIGSEVSKKVTGKKSKTTAKDIAGKAVGSAARTATRQLTRSVLGTLLK
jgi:DNA helicase HerA-like ATPase